MQKCIAEVLYLGLDLAILTEDHELIATFTSDGDRKPSEFRETLTGLMQT